MLCLWLLKLVTNRVLWLQLQSNGYCVPNRYVSRVNYLDSSKHAILGTQQFRPKEFATQIALNMDNAWGILRCIIDTCMKLPDGKYLILKDPLKVSNYRQNVINFIFIGMRVNNAYYYRVIYKMLTVFDNAVESRLLEPPRETKICFENWGSSRNWV